MPKGFGPLPWAKSFFVYAWTPISPSLQCARKECLKAFQSRPHTPKGAYNMLKKNALRHFKVGPTPKKGQTIC